MNEDHSPFILSGTAITHTMKAQQQKVANIKPTI